MKSSKMKGMKAPTSSYLFLTPAIFSRKVKKTKKKRRKRRERRKRR